MPEQEQGDIEQRDIDYSNKLKEFYDGQVEFYDKLYSKFSFEDYEIRKALEAKNFVKGKCLVLDAGCGNGNKIKFLASGAKRIIGVDFSVEMLRLAKDNCKGLNCELLQMDCTKTAFKSESFDFVYCIGVISCPNDSLIVKELSGMLKPGGVIVFNYNNKALSSIAINMLARLKLRLGLGSLKSKLFKKIYYKLSNIKSLLKEHNLEYKSHVGTSFLFINNHKVFNNRFSFLKNQATIVLVVAEKCGAR